MEANGHGQVQDNKYWMERLENLFKAHIPAQNYSAAYNWCIANIGPQGYIPFLPDNLFEQTEVDVYDSFWTIGGNTFFFKNITNWQFFKSVWLPQEN